MRKRYLAILICVCLSVLGSSFATPFYDDPPNQTPIVLRGTLDYNQGPSDIETYTDQMNVYVIFHRSFGLVNITLYNEFWMSIYSDVVNTSVQQTVVIPITGTSDGVYTLVLENANGYAEGDYVKEP